MSDSTPSYVRAGPPWMMACLRSTDRGKTFALINTDATLGLGRDREAGLARASCHSASPFSFIWRIPMIGTHSRDE
jgi:hypothetical protein